jgi:hypothetical protein
MSKQSKKRRKRQRARAAAARRGPVTPAVAPQRPQAAPPAPPVPTRADSTAGESGVGESGAVDSEAREPDPGEPGSPGRRVAVSLLAVGLVVLVAGGLVSRHLLQRHDGTAPLVTLSQPSDLAPPRPVPAGSSYVRTVVLPSGDLAVTHWIHTRKPMTSVRVRRPSVANLPRVIADDVRVVPGFDPRARAPAVSDGQQKQLYILGGARRVYVSYVLKGAVENELSPPGRALARITTFDVRSDQPETSSIHTVRGARVLALACSQATPDALPEPCGSTGDATGGGDWQVRLDDAATDDRVMAQLDLSGGQ